MDLQLSDDSLRYEHTFPASAETLFQHFTEASLAKQWMAPGDMHVSSVQMDAVEGGNFTLEMTDTDGEVYTAYGVYQTVEANKRLVYSWQWQHVDAPETQVEIDFIEVEAGCMIRFQHYGFATAEATKNHSEGWKGILVKLASLL